MKRIASIAKPLAFLILITLLSFPLAYPKQITVTKDGSGKYDTIQAAIDEAKNGDTIYVKPGVYEESIIFKEGITLRGAKEQPIIKYGGPNAVITASSIDEGRIDGFKIEYAGEVKTSAILLISSNITISDCTITGAIIDGIKIKGKSESKIYNNIIYENNDDGIDIRDDANPLIESNIIKRNNNDGIALLDKAEAYIRRNEIYENKDDGIHGEDSTNPIIEYNVIRDNESDGIIILDNAKGVIRKNEMYGNESNGIRVIGSAAPLVEGNTLKRNKFEGVAIYENSKPNIRANEVFENADDGIDIWNSATPVVKYNKVFENEGTGIESEWPAKSRIENNVVYSNGANGIGIIGPIPHFDDINFSALKEGSYHLKEVSSKDVNRHFGIFFVKTSEKRFAKLKVIFSFKEHCLLQIKKASMYEEDGTIHTELEDQSLEPMKSFDLDQAEIGASGADLYFDCSSRNVFYLRSRNDSAFSLPTKMVNNLGPIPSRIPVVENNTIVKNNDNGIFIAYLAQPDIKNNIITMNNWDGIDVTDSAYAGGTYGPDGEPTLSYNNVWESEENYEGIDKPPTDLSVDPQFVNTENNDFHLTSSSPCIGAGEGGVDMGAHQYSKINQTSVARFSYIPSEPKAGKFVTFDASASNDPDGIITKYTWDFGDGYTVKGMQVVHTFVNEGEYQVVLSVTDNDGATGSTSKKITVGKVEKNKPPRASFTFSPTSPEVDQPVRFDASQSSDPDGSITHYAWDFGDGFTGSGEISPHQYKEIGTYLVTLTVIDEDKGTDSTSKKITVTEIPNEYPQANFTYSPSNPTDLDEVHFTDKSTDPDGKVVKWQWDFGDGSTSNEQNPTHQYEDNGTYQVELTVTDDQGATDSITKEIEVSNVFPKADFNYSPTKLIVNASVTFDASNSSDPDGKIKEYQWEFGDSPTGTGKKVSHTYTSEGRYQVKLTITDDDGDTDSIQKELEVTTPPPEIKARYGIVIGVSDYKYADDKTCPGFCDLKYPAQDAKAFYELLVDEKIGAFPKDNVTLLIDDKATVSAIKSAFSRLIAKVGKDDLVVIYYSGHGGQGPDLNNDEGDGTDEYYIAYNTQPKDADKLFASGIRDDEFGDWLNSLRSKQVTILLDSCYSGGATKTIKGTSPPDYKAGPNNSVFNDFSFEDRFLLSASQENQVSFESEELGHGVFTHFLLEGLKGKADLDQDGEITSEEVYEYVKPKVNEYVTTHWPGYSQIPFNKGAVTTAVVSKQRVLKGKITAIEGEKKQAQVGDHVLINLGSKDGVKAGDTFEVYHQVSSKGVIITEVRGKIKVIDVIEDHRSICEVTEAKFPIEVGDKVREVPKE